MSYALPKTIKVTDISRAFTIWKGMIARCTTASNTAYSIYGGRGIKVCKRWVKSFAVFVEDMGIPEAHESIDRKNNEGDYKPSNCRWATSLEQNSHIPASFQ